MSINKKFYQKRVILICLRIANECFCMPAADVSNCNRDCAVHKPEHICYLALYGKSLSTFDPHSTFRLVNVQKDTFLSLLGMFIKSRIFRRQFDDRYQLCHILKICMLRCICQVFLLPVVLSQGTFSATVFPGVSETISIETDVLLMLPNLERISRSLSPAYPGIGEKASAGTVLSAPHPTGLKRRSHT